MRAHTEAATRVPVFGEWVGARAHALQRFSFLVAGDRTLSTATLERALQSVHQQWREVAVATDPEIYVRQEVLRVQASRRHRRTRSAASDVPEPPSGEALHRRAWEVCQAMALEERAALVLRYADDLDVVDAADVLGRDQAAVRGLWASGRARVSSLAAPRSTDRRPAEIDTEALLGDTFRDYAALAPDDADVAHRVLVRGRRRRRRQTAVGAVAAVAVLSPLVWPGSPFSPDQPGEGSAPTPGTPLAAVPGMRWESYGGVEVRVPDHWGHGDLTQWCAPESVPGHVDGPSVDRPGTGRTVLCSANHLTGNRGVERPTYTQGLLLRPAGEGPRIGRADVAPGASVYRSRVGGVDLTVVDVGRELASRILSSATEVSGEDLRGCPTHTPLPAMGRFVDVRSTYLSGLSGPGTPGPESVSICHYETQPWDRPTLVFSERSGRRVARSLASAMTAARPLAEQQLEAARARDCPEPEAALVRFWARGVPTDVWVHYAGCGSLGLDDGAQPRELSRQVLRPILDEPWRGVVGDGAPWPPGPGS